jgi:hypothetical protein
MSVPNITGRMGRAGSSDRPTAPGAGARGQSIDRLQAPGFRAHDNPSPMGSPRVEVVKVLSTAGTGVSRDNEKKEAVGNINRLFSIAKIKKDDAARVAGAKSRGVEAVEGQNSSYEESRSYKLLKQEEIQKSGQRAAFLSSSERVRIPQSPRPFRDPTPRLEEPARSCAEARPRFASAEIPFNTITDLLPKLNQQQATHVGLTLFGQMAQDTVMEVLAQQLAVMSGVQMAAVFGGLSLQVTAPCHNPIVFPRP